MLDVSKKKRYVPALLCLITAGVSTVAASVLMTMLLPLPVLSQTLPDPFLKGGGTLSRGMAIASHIPPFKCFLWLQNDGNLVLYYRDVPGNRLITLWASGTDGRTVGKAVMQTDGNFVLYDEYNGRPV